MYASDMGLAPLDLDRLDEPPQKDAVAPIADLPTLEPGTGRFDPNRSLVAGHPDGEKCSRAMIEPGTASDGIRGKLSFVGALLLASGGRFAVGNCWEMAIPTLFLPPETADLLDRRRVKD